MFLPSRNARQGNSWQCRLGACDERITRTRQGEHTHTDTHTHCIIRGFKLTAADWICLLYGHSQVKECGVVL